MRAIKQSFKYGITSALLVILLGGMQACADASPMEPNASPSTARFNSTVADTVWVESHTDATECVLVNGQWQCPGKPR